MEYVLQHCSGERGRGLKEALFGKTNRNRKAQRWLFQVILVATVTRLLHSCVSFPPRNSAEIEISLDCIVVTRYIFLSILLSSTFLPSTHHFRTLEYARSSLFQFSSLLIKNLLFIYNVQ